MWGWILAAAVASAPFDFRGAQLGMTLDQFKALPGLTAPIACEADPSGALGVHRCVRPGDNPYEPDNIGADYKFGPGADGQPRLYEAWIMLRAANTDAALASLRDRWGDPNGLNPAQAQNLYGASLPSLDVFWKRGRTQIELKNPCGSTRYFCIYYRDPDAAARADQAIAKAKAAKVPSF